MQLRSVHVACCMLPAPCCIPHVGCCMCGADIARRTRYATMRTSLSMRRDVDGTRASSLRAQRRVGASCSVSAWLHHATVGRQRAVAMPCWRFIPSPLGRSFRPRPSRARLLLLQIYIGQELLSYFFESVSTPRLRCTRHVVGCLRCAVQRCRARVACRTVPARGVRRRRPRLTAVRTHLIRISPSGPSLARHRHRPGAKCARHESVGRGSLLLTARHGTDLGTDLAPETAPPTCSATLTPTVAEMCRDGWGCRFKSVAPPRHKWDIAQAVLSASGI